MTMVQVPEQAHSQQNPTTKAESAHFQTFSASATLCVIADVKRGEIPMVRFLLSVLLFVSVSVQASSSLRVDNKVLTIGDTAARVQQLMGEPTARVVLPAQTGPLPENQLLPREQWQYAQDGKTIVITIIGGRAISFDTRYEP
jgi:hypothetical protein